MFASIAALGLLSGTPAYACGGFFCSGGQTTTTTTTTEQQTQVAEAPVIQKSERILFQVNEEEGTITTYVEVAYEQTEDVEFSWIIPLPALIRADDVQTANADMFNALEEATAPRFAFTWIEENYNYNYNYGSGYYSYGYGRGGSGSTSSGGCGGLGCAEYSSKSSGSYDTGGVALATAPSTATTTEGGQEFAVTVIDEAVVGPFAIEVIEASDNDDFGEWLTFNGYDFPDEARFPMSVYVDAGMPFLGIKLAPDVPEGPIDTLVFTYPSDNPMIPIILTQIAACPDLPIIAYVLADTPYVPGNWAEADSVADQTRPTLAGDSVDYDVRLNAAIDVFGGQAFIREFTRPTADFEVPDPTYEAAIDAGGQWLTRLRGSVSPHEMTVDPWFEADPTASEIDNFHEILLDDAPTSYDRRRGPRRVPSNVPWGAGLVLLLPVLGVLRRRRD